ncbi:MAG: hypothetical protein J6X28_05510, partial [Bacilli bacterium]|nr:hypothetical protein [Bacilli bacterium]
YILLYTKEMIAENFKNFIEFDYQNAEVIKMMNQTPLLLTYNAEELRRRLQYYKEKHVLKELKENSTNLLISLEFIQKREKYIKNNKRSDLFFNDKEFEEKYHIIRKQVIEGVK